MFMILYLMKNEKERATMKKVKRSIVSVIALLICILLVACHNTGLASESSHIDPVNTSSETTKYTIPLSTDPLPKMYTYRVIGGIHPVDIQLHFQIEDYMETGEDGNRVFDLESVADDCGWKKTDDYYYYDYGEVWLKFEIFFEKSSHEDATWLGMLRCTYVYPDSPEQIYYEFEGTPVSDTDGFEMRFEVDDNCEICETKDGYYLYFRDAVIVACIFSTAVVHPGINPTRTYGLSAYGLWPSNEADKREKTNKFYIGPEIPRC